MHIHAAPPGTLITIGEMWELQSLVGKGSFAKGELQYLLGLKQLSVYMNSFLFTSFWTVDAPTSSDDVDRQMTGPVQLL